MKNKKSIISMLSITSLYVSTAFASIPMPEIISPTEDTTVSGSEVVFQWGAIANVSQYEFTVYKRNGEDIVWADFIEFPATPELAGCISANTCSYTHTVPYSEAAWNIRAVSTSEEPSEYTDNIRFALSGDNGGGDNGGGDNGGGDNGGTNTPFGMPEIILPNESTTISSNSVTFKWNAVADVSQYELTVYKRNGEDIVWVGYDEFSVTPEKAGCTNSTTCSYTHSVSHNEAAWNIRAVSTSDIASEYTDNQSFTLTTGAGIVPHEISKFQSALNQSSLQWQSNDGNYNITHNLEGISTEYYYLSDDGYMTLETEQSGNKRVELRQKQEWDTATGAGITANIKCIYPESIEEYTWMQVFGKDKGKPLVRLIWRKSRAGLENHLWAFIKKENGEEKIDLGTNPDSFFNAQITIQNNNLKVKIDDAVKVDMYVGYWNSDNYFKTGVYLGGSANNNVPEGQRSAKVQFNSLTYQTGIENKQQPYTGREIVDEKVFVGTYDGSDKPANGQRGSIVFLDYKDPDNAGEHATWTKKSTGQVRIVSDDNSLDNALNSVQAGDIIRLKSGVYKLRDFQISGTEDKPITIESEYGEWAIFDGAKNNSSWQISITNQSWVNFRNFEVKNGSGGSIDVRQSHHLLFEGLKIHNNAEGFSFTDGSHHSVVRFNESYHNYDKRNHGNNGDGFTFWSENNQPLGEGIIVEHNIAWANSDDGIDMFMNETSVSIRNNIVRNSGFNVVDDSEFQGNGNCYKLGPKTNGHWLIGNIADACQGDGFDANDDSYSAPHYLKGNHSTNNGGEAYDTSNRSAFDDNYETGGILAK